MDFFSCFRKFYNLSDEKITEERRIFIFIKKKKKRTNSMRKKLLSGHLNTRSNIFCMNFLPYKAFQLRN